MQITVGLVIIAIIIGVFSGMLSGLVGVGGGIIIVPCLVYFLAYSQKMAQGTSLAVLTLPVVALGMYQYYKNGQVDYKMALLIAIGFVIGSLLGGKLANKMSDDVLKKVFGVLLLLIALKILFIDKNKNNTSAQQQQSKAG